MHPRVIDILESAGTEAAVIRPTELYNEGWMLRLILDWDQQHAPESHPLVFLPVMRSGIPRRCCGPRFLRGGGATN